MRQRVLQWFQRTDHMWLVVLILAAIFLRFWRVPETLQFLGDQGRDAQIVSRIFKEGDLVFIGPVTSVGNMYLGPLYYYFMVPFLWMSYPSPLGPVYAVALLGVAAVWLMYSLGKEIVGPKAALVGAGVATFSSLLVEYSRFSWNPNPAPLVATVMIWATHRAWTKGPKWWIVVSICFSILIQLHYLALLAGGAAGLIWLADMWRHLRRPTKTSSKSNNSKLSTLLLMTGVSAAIFLVSLTPLFLFDLKHDGINASAFTKLFTKEEAFAERNQTLSMTTLRAIKETHGRSMLILFEVTIGQHLWLNTGLVILTFATLFRLVRQKSNPYRAGLGVLLTYLVVGIAGTAAYSHSVFHHYILFLLPVTCWIYGVMVATWWQRWYGKAAMAAFTALFAWYNLTHYPFKPIGWTVADVERTAATLHERVKPGEKYNLVLLSGTGDIDAQNYRYFLEASDLPPVPITQRGEVSTLFIINEDRKLPKVVDSPIYEIVVFPNKQPAEVYTVPGGPEITVLRTLLNEPTPK